MPKLAVVAIGGNSLITPGDHRVLSEEWAMMAETCRHLVPLIEQGWELVVTHGNGPQIGFVVGTDPRMPLDAGGAQTQGAMGYMAQVSLDNELARRGLQKRTATLLTRTLVDPNDKAFQHPTKPIGRFYTQEQANQHEFERGWTMVSDAGRGWRRVVCSPKPVEILETAAIQSLLTLGFVVVCLGGGGIPVARDELGQLRGIEAVIDKDLAASLLARTLNADLFLISTGVERVALNYMQPTQLLVDRLRMDQAKTYFDQGQFPAGSMGPKIQAAMEYLESGGKEVLITCPHAISRALGGETGTRIVA